MKRVVFLCAGLLFLSLLQAQSLTGVWRGYFYSGLGLFKQQYKFEVQFNQLKNKALKGVTYSYNTTSFYGKAGLKGIYKTEAKSVILKEDTLIEVRGDFGQTCLMTCYLDYSKDGKTEILQGDFSSVVMSSGADCGGGVVYLERVENSDFTKEDFLLKKPAAPLLPIRRKPIPPPLVKQLPKTYDTAFHRQNAPPMQDTLAKNTKPVLPVPPALTERKNDLVRTIVTNAPDIKIDLYDNGEIDGDTITVYHNNEVVAYRKGLSATAITLHIQASPQNPRHEFVMYADNLGKIPPNTALMVITTGSKRYELSLISTTEKNAKVIIEYKPGDK